MLPLVLGLLAIAPVSPELPDSTAQTVAEAEEPSRLQGYYSYLDYTEVVEKTVAMVFDTDAQQLADRFGLDILNVTWEDTGRFYDSAVGPNISDMTIQVEQHNPIRDERYLSLMPVIRHPNFTDESADVDIDNFYLLVGNEKGEALQRVSLREFLDNLPEYLHDGESWAGDETSLLADRDTHVLVSAQACFLPIPDGGTATFNPVLFNYQSYEGDPAVLTILVTREGSSVTVIDNVRDGFDGGRTWGQRLFFNKNGERASLTGQRLSDFQAGSSDGSGDSDGDPVAEAAGEEGLNMVMLIQVPLKQKNPDDFGGGISYAPLPSMPAAEESQRSDVEAAVIGHGEVEGPFTEIDNLEIERDPDFPVRVTVQFYKATSNGIVSEEDMRQIHEQIARVYEDGDYVGSLVVGGPSDRPTEHDGPKTEPPGWWDDFWNRYEENTGQSREEAIEMWYDLTGSDRYPESEAELREWLEERDR